MYQLSQVNRFTLNEKFDNRTAEWLYDLSNGIDNEPVSDRRITKSIGCGKNFRGKNALSRIEDINQWIQALLKELYERMVKDKEMNQRLAKLMIVGYYTAGKGHCHRSIPIDITSGDYPLPERISADIMRQLFSRPEIIAQDPLQNLSLAATKFVDASIALADGTAKIEKFFQKINRDAFVEQSTKNHSIQQSIELNQKQPKKSLIKKQPNQVQSNTMDRYLRHQQQSTWSKANNNDKIDLNDPHVRQINRETNQLLDSFFYNKILQSMEI
ncbi:hypothetical protein BLA29_005050 [Euroglyphus maynei]|uniref:DNA polymerase Y-family little finger domain-containing protein n=1 Tax=Euroglyphus maynei TaxID=6958 RepID=A0A1Y3APK2_EURMA|nr:hypothetical protein BLA29_005050 [Euroglyphus maynei]